MQMTWSNKLHKTSTLRYNLLNIDAPTLETANKKEKGQEFFFENILALDNNILRLM